MPTLDVPDGTADRSGARRSVALVLAGVVAVVVVGSVVLVALAAFDDGERARQDAVAERGAAVMPFDLDATTHVFEPTQVGVVQTVVADRRGDVQQVRLIRRHLREERERFMAGDFGDPASIHGHDMPGLSVLEARTRALTIAYRDVPAGARVTYRSDDPVVVEALHDWFAAQLADHGEHARSR